MNHGRCNLVNRTFKIEYHGTTYDGVPAVIQETFLGLNDHGIFDAWLHLAGQGWGQGFGGYALDQWDAGLNRRIGTGFGLDWVGEILRTLGVESWEKVKGQEVIALYSEGDSWGGQIKGFAHTLEDRAMIVREFIDFWKERKA